MASLDLIRRNNMDIGKILAELRLERDQLAEAIASLERLATHGAKRRGRPPAWLAKAKAADPDNAEPLVQAKVKRKKAKAA